MRKNRGFISAFVVVAMAAVSCAKSSDKREANLSAAVGPCGQRILSPLKSVSPSLTKRYEPVFIGLAVVKVSIRLVTYQHILPPS